MKRKNEKKYLLSSTVNEKFIIILIVVPYIIDLYYTYSVFGGRVQRKRFWNKFPIDSVNFSRSRISNLMRLRFARIFKIYIFFLKKTVV